MTEVTDKRVGPRADTESAVFHAALQILMNEGARALTPLRIHQVSGVARTTVYRHWPNPAVLVQQLVDVATVPRHTEQMTGELKHDLTLTIQVILDRIQHRPMRKLYAALVEWGTTSDDPLVTAEEYMRGLAQPTADVIAAAVTSGELAGDADDLTSRVLGPVFHRYLLLGDEIADAVASEAVDVFLQDHNA